MPGRIETEENMPKIDIRKPVILTLELSAEEFADIVTFFDTLHENVKLPEAFKALRGRL